MCNWKSGSDSFYPWLGPGNRKHYEAAKEEESVVYFPTVPFVERFSFDCTRIAICTPLLTFPLLRHFAALSTKDTQPRNPSKVLKQHTAEIFLFVVPPLHHHHDRCCFFTTGKWQNY